jgi:TRAP-type mannitol/chloroaromatic compound transport system permease small subunit
MPDLNFVLPHWLYWLVLLLVPLIGMVVVRRSSRDRTRSALSLPFAYLLWFSGGFVGLHRFYVKNWLGAVYIPLFLAILYGNIHVRDARLVLSEARTDVTVAEFQVEHFQAAVDAGDEGASERLATAEQALVTAKEQLATATDSISWWQTATGVAAAVIALLLLIDAVLLPGLVRRRAALEGPAPEFSAAPTAEVPRAGTAEDPARLVRTRVTNVIDSISGWTGEFVAYWSIIAVFAYYYEVVARYVFNSPTNWAHESMFLMFGMQYLISGAYAYREDAHVRVDVLYLYLSERGKVITDIITSIFFFIFSGALLVTGWIFMMDSVNVWEVSFTEWAIQYWPVKIAIPLGAFLILLQGLSKLIKDITLLRRMGA